MKISELPKSSIIAKAMEIPVAIAGENRSITLGQIIDALATVIVPFAEVSQKNYSFEQIAGGASTTALPVIFRNGGFYGLQEITTTVSGVENTQALLYHTFPGSENFYDEDGGVRTDCLFISNDGHLYRYTGTALISAGITDAQAQQIKLLTPQPVESESVLQAMEAAGLIVPGQLYYIPEDD